MKTHQSVLYSIETNRTQSTALLARHLGPGCDSTVVDVKYISADFYHMSDWLPDDHVDATRAIFSAPTVGLLLLCGLSR